MRERFWPYSTEQVLLPYGAGSNSYRSLGTVSVTGSINRMNCIAATCVFGRPIADNNHLEGIYASSAAATRRLFISLMLYTGIQCCFFFDDDGDNDVAMDDSILFICVIWVQFKSLKQNREDLARNNDIMVVIVAVFLAYKLPW